MLGFGSTQATYAQNPSSLETKITLRVSNERMDEVLRQIAAQGGFSFSYSPDAIAVDSRVSLNASNQSVREILNVLFDGKVLFRERRKYIILQKAPEMAEKKPEAFYLNGYVIDETTGEKLPNASIYEPVTLASAVSNQYGYYKIKLPAQSEKLRLEVRKEDYAGRSVEILSRSNAYFSITLVPDTLRPVPLTRTLPDTIKVIAPREPRIAVRMDSSKPQIEIPVVVVAETADLDSIIPIRRKEKTTLTETLKDLRDGLVFALSTARQAVHVENIQDSLHRPFQASLMPFIGTNGELSGNVVNDFSLNLVAGYSLGVDMAEAGLGFNLVRGEVCCVQTAGVANVVGREVRGIQAAGVANLVIGNFYGFQTASLNITAGNFQGLQLGGVNVAGGVLEGWQLAGAMNIANRVRSGHQVGIVNYADSSATVPFGYFSFVRVNGYRRLELTTDELNYGNVTFKTGVRKFYNIFTLGTNLFLPDKPTGSIGYGIGTARYLGHRQGDARQWMLDLNFVASRVALEKKFLKQPYAVHTRLSLNLERKISPRLALSVGPTFNLFFSPYTGLLREDRNRLPSIRVATDNNGEGSTYGWIGFQVGLRLCNRSR